MSVIFHIDVNSAYLSWTAVEELKNGKERDLRQIPAIIGGDQKTRHGVVLAKSIPAKKYGIRTGEPVVSAFRKCPGLVTAPPDHKLYRRYSNRLMEYLQSYTPVIEQVSVDECYMDFSQNVKDYHSPVEGAMEIKNEVYRRFGFTVNVGISSNKLLAKMASDFEKPNKVHTLFPEEIQVKMWPLPVAKLYMAGNSSVEVLRKLGIFTIGELARMEPSLLELHLKSHGRRLWEFANGMGNAVVEPEPGDAKGIGNSTTLSKDAETEEEAKEVLKMLAASVGRRLRKAGQKAKMLSVEIKYYNFESASHQKQLGRGTNRDEEIYEEAVWLFRELWNKNPIRLLGIRSSKLAEEDEQEQMTIFDPQFQFNPKREKEKKINQALEKVRIKYGERIVTRGTKADG
ncbi:MAG: DNA polymerase IV [Dorea sp.]|jgi:DNA polymerase-4|nr:DNA polymerase IV [Dorea sp.]